jgi:hypothetical protein
MRLTSLVFEPTGHKMRHNPAVKGNHFLTEVSQIFEFTHFWLVGAAGFEPATTRTPSVCATRLRHAPTE